MDRRKFLASAGGVVLGGTLGGAALANSETGLRMPSKACKATLRTTPGPFRTLSPMRADIREDRVGVPVKLSVKVVNDWSCDALAGIPVEIWQCDAAGIYSNVVNMVFDHATLRPVGDGPDTRGQMFLRGYQVTDARGVVEFTTIFPGWYTARVPHIHLRAVTGGVDWTAHDTQLFFDEKIERAVLASAAYAARGPNPLTPERDLVLHGDRNMLKALTVPLAKDGDGYRGNFELAIQSL